MTIVVVDNYDSFTFNLVQMVSRIARARGAPEGAVSVLRNDAASVDEVLASRPGAVLISPGPGLPHEAGISAGLVRRAPDDLPIFGVCLGMQTIAEVLGARIVRAPRTMHGRTSSVLHDARGCFAGVPSPFTAMRYHSWVVDEASLPASLEACAWADDGTLMGIRHRHRPIEAVQFHPESFLTAHGEALLVGLVERGLGRARGD